MQELLPIAVRGWNQDADFNVLLFRDLVRVLSRLLPGGKASYAPSETGCIRQPETCAGPGAVRPAMPGPPARA